MGEPDIRIDFKANTAAVLACLNEKPHIRALAWKLARLIEEHGELDIATAWATAVTHVAAQRKRCQQAAREGETTDG